MSLDALPVFLVSVFWTPFLYLAGAIWVVCMVYAIWGAFNHIYSNKSE